MSAVRCSCTCDALTWGLSSVFLKCASSLGPLNAHNVDLVHFSTGSSTERFPRTVLLCDGGALSATTAVHHPHNAPILPFAGGVLAILRILGAVSLTFARGRVRMQKFAFKSPAKRCSKRDTARKNVQILDRWFGVGNRTVS